MNSSLHYEKDDSLELSGDTPVIPDPPTKKSRLPAILVITLAAIVVSTLVGVGVYSATKKSSKKPTPTQITINTQSLDAGTLTKLTKQAGASKAKQELVINPDTVFENTVVVHDTVKTDKGLAVTGALDVGSGTNLQGSVVIGGNLAVRGALSVAGTLSADSLNAGALAVTNLTASGSLNFSGHLVPNGAEPTIAAAIAAAGGTASVVGNDTSGTIIITTGSGSLMAGEMAIVHFHSGYKTTPKIQLTPVNVSTATMNYYASRSPGFFTIDIASAPATNTVYAFDYLITE